MIGTFSGQELSLLVNSQLPASRGNRRLLMNGRRLLIGLLVIIVTQPGWQLETYKYNIDFRRLGIGYTLGQARPRV